MSYRTVEVNKDLTRVYKDAELVGTVRKGLDHFWYPQLLSRRSRGAAVHVLVVAHEAITEVLDELG